MRHRSRFDHAGSYNGDLHAPGMAADAQKGTRMIITSRNNPRIKEAVELVRSSDARRSSGLYIVEGPRMVDEIPRELTKEIFMSESYAARQPDICDIIKDDERTEDQSSQCSVKYFELHDPEDRPDDVFSVTPVTVVSDDVFAKISDTKNPQGIAAVVRMKQYTVDELLTGGPVLILENIQDPGNLGTMIRSAEGAGAGGIVIDPGTVDVYNPKVIRATMGAFFRVPHVVCGIREAVAALHEAGYVVYAAHLDGQESFTGVSYGRAAFMIGNEGRGLSDAAAALADVRIRIPMEGKLESLNASVAASLLMYEWHRQKY